MAVMIKMIMVNILLKKMMITVMMIAVMIMMTMMIILLKKMIMMIYFKEICQGNWWGSASCPPTKMGSFQCLEQKSLKGQIDRSGGSPVAPL